MRKIQLFLAACFVLQGSLCFAQSVPTDSAAHRPNTVDDAPLRIMVFSSNREIDPQYMNGTLPWPKPGTPEWAKNTFKLMAEIASSHLNKRLNAEGVDSKHVSIKEGAVSIQDAVGRAVVQLKRNRLLQVSALSRKEGDNKGIRINVSLMGMKRGKTAAGYTPAKIVGIWEQEFEFQMRANPPGEKESPITVEAVRIANQAFEILKNGKHLNAPPPPVISLK